MARFRDQQFETLLQLEQDGFVAELETECIAVRCLDSGAGEIIGRAVQTPEEYPIGRH